MKKCLIVLFVFLIPGLLFAQRQTQGHMSVELYGTIGPAMRSFRSGHAVYGELKTSPSFGGGAALSYYGFSGRFVVGIDYLRRPHGYSEPAIYDKYDNLISPNFCYFYKANVISVSAGYMHRLWSTRSRNFIVSGGGYLDIGVSVCEEVAGHYASGSSVAEKPSGFYLGLVPDVQVEYFPLPSSSVFASFCSRMSVVDLLPGYTNWFTPVFRLGVKYYL